jgi:hypothetical protein
MSYGRSESKISRRIQQRRRNNPNSPIELALSPQAQEHSIGVNVADLLKSAERHAEYRKALSRAQTMPEAVQAEQDVLSERHRKLFRPTAERLERAASQAHYQKRCGSGDGGRG